MWDARHFPTVAYWWSWLCAVNYRRLRRKLLAAAGALAALAVFGLCVLAAVWNYQKCMFVVFRIEYMGSHVVYGIDGRRLERGPLTPKERRVAEWYEAKARKYRRAAWQPWLLLLPDPRRPES